MRGRGRPPRTGPYSPLRPPLAGSRPSARPISIAPTSSMGRPIIQRNGKRASVAPPSVTSSARQETTLPVTSQAPPPLRQNTASRTAGSVEAGPPRMETHELSGSLAAKTTTACVASRRCQTPRATPAPRNNRVRVRRSGQRQGRGTLVPPGEQGGFASRLAGCPRGPALEIPHHPAAPPSLSPRLRDHPAEALTHLPVAGRDALLLLVPPGPEYLVSPGGPGRSVAAVMLLAARIRRIDHWAATTRATPVPVDIQSAGIHIAHRIAARIAV